MNYYFEGYRIKVYVSSTMNHDSLFTTKIIHCRPSNLFYDNLQNNTTEKIIQQKKVVYKIIKPNIHTKLLHNNIA